MVKMGGGPEAPATPPFAVRVSCQPGSGHGRQPTLQPAQTEGGVRGWCCAHSTCECGRGVVCERGLGGKRTELPYRPARWVARPQRGLAPHRRFLDRPVGREGGTTPSRPWVDTAVRGRAVGGRGISRALLYTLLYMWTTAFKPMQAVTVTTPRPARRRHPLGRVNRPTAWPRASAPAVPCGSPPPLRLHLPNRTRESARARLPPNTRAQQGSGAPADPPPACPL